MTSILVTSAGPANGGGLGRLLHFDGSGELVGPFSNDPRVTDPRGLCISPSSELIYVNSGSDRVLALNRDGEIILDSGPVLGLDPGGGVFGPDGRYYVGSRHRRTIVAFRAGLDRPAAALLRDAVVPFPRGFGFSQARELYLASGIGPSGKGDNTVLIFDKHMTLLGSVDDDPHLSPLDLTIAPNGNILVASEQPFGDDNATVTIREYHSITGRLWREFVPDPELDFRRPRGLRFGADGTLYCAGESHVIAFDHHTGDFLGPVIELANLNGQALVLLE